MLNKLGIDWTFQDAFGDLNARERIRKRLKPAVEKWVNSQYPLLLKELKNDRLTNQSTITEMFPVSLSGITEPFWLAVQFSVNRTEPDFVLVFVGAEKKVGEIFYDSLLRGAEDWSKSVIQSN